MADTVNYAKRALRALRFAGMDEYDQLGADEREEFTALVKDWMRITRKRNEALADIAAEEDDNAQRQCTRQRIEARAATVEDACACLSDSARQQLEAHITEEAEFDMPLDGFLDRLAPAACDQVMSLIATI